MIMLDHKDIKAIIQDLEVVIGNHLKNEEYELCKIVSDINQSFIRYIQGDEPYEEIIPNLFRVCISRYKLYRLHKSGNKRFAIFLLPDTTMLFFHVDNEEDNSPVWADLQVEYDIITEKLDEYIKENYEDHTNFTA